MYFDLDKTTLTQKILIIVRGLPSSGKSTIAKLLIANSGIAICADEYLTTPDGEYCFSKMNFIEAQKMCKKDCELLMHDGVSPIVIHNTMAEAWESKDYFEYAEKFGYQTHVLNLYDAGCNDQELATRNTHAMPSHLIQKMRQKWNIDIYPHRQKDKILHQESRNQGVPSSTFLHTRFQKIHTNSDR